MFGDPKFVAVYVNAQEKAGSGAKASINASAIRVVVVDGAIDVNVSRTMAGAFCGNVSGTAVAEPPSCWKADTCAIGSANALACKKPRRDIG